MYKPHQDFINARAELAIGFNDFVQALDTYVDYVRTQSIICKDCVEEGREGTEDKYRLIMMSEAMLLINQVMEVADIIGGGIVEGEIIIVRSAEVELD